ncbi:hypothetical protein FOL47_003382 [Perkinsus chesapeaki]|uniref:Uncharacterized protein n=1 Tax=Perkinsus chesapeaki TaxID=330153 RepID=A0A7J6M888_PERCH|nr:hypothetical protein FOL47_003382 [Perkinsus chesapeaki]
MEDSGNPEIPELPLADSARTTSSTGRKVSTARGRRKKFTLDQVEAELCQRLVDTENNFTKTDEHLAKLLARKLTFPEDDHIIESARDRRTNTDAEYKLKEAEGLIAMLQDELSAARRANADARDEARCCVEESENLKCALRDIRRDNERLTAERDHAICQQYEARKIIEDRDRNEAQGYQDLLATHERTLINLEDASMELERVKDENRRLMDELVKCKVQLASFREKRDNADLIEAHELPSTEGRLRRDSRDRRAPLTARTWGAVKKALGQYKPPVHRTPSPPGVSRYPSDAFNSDKIFRDDSGIDGC